MQHFAPFRPLGITFVVTLAAGIYISPRQRLGAWPALVLAIAVLWVHSLQLTPFLFNFHLALLLGVICAAALPSRTARADATLAVALTAALCTSAVGLAVAAACVVHSLLGDVRLGRWLAVGLPVSGWVGVVGVSRSTRPHRVRIIPGRCPVRGGRIVWLLWGRHRSRNLRRRASIAMFSIGLLAWRAAHDRQGRAHAAAG